MAIPWLLVYAVFFFFNDTATTEIYTLSLHDALPISVGAARKTAQIEPAAEGRRGAAAREGQRGARDRKSTRLNSSHQIISYAVFCLKKKKKYPHASHCTDAAITHTDSRQTTPAHIAA